MTKSKLIYSKKYDHVFKYQTKDGFKWGYRYPYYDSFHRRKEASHRKYSTAKDAYTALLDVQKNIVTNQTDIVSNSNITVAQWTQQWLESMRPNWAASTFYNYKQVVRSYIIPLLGHVKLSELTRVKYQELYLNWSPVNKIDNLNRDFFVLCHD